MPSSLLPFLKLPISSASSSSPKHLCAGMRSISFIPCVVSFFVSLPSRQNRTVLRSAIGCPFSPPFYLTFAFPPLLYPSESSSTCVVAFSLYSIFRAFSFFFFTVYCFRASLGIVPSHLLTSESTNKEYRCKNVKSCRLSQKK